MEMAEKKGPLTSADYKAALATNRQQSRALGIDAVMTKFKLDALVAPTGGPAWLIDLVNGDGGTATLPGPSTVTSVAGYPHITVPAGSHHGLPVGVSFFGAAWSEPHADQARVRLRTGDQTTPPALSSAPPQIWRADHTSAVSNRHERRRCACRGVHIHEIDAHQPRRPGWHLRCELIHWEVTPC
jgi:hypothetical protein